MTKQPLARIAIHGPPRSGTTWLGELFNSSPNTIYKFQPLFSYALKGYIGADANSARVQKFFSKLQSIQDEFVDQSNARKAGNLPTFKKANPTHLVYKEVRYHHVLPNLLSKAKDARLILVVRDPIATLESWINAPREFRRDLGWTVAEEWQFAPQKNQARPEEFFGFDGWKRAIEIFHQVQVDFPDRVKIVRYEKLLEEPQTTITQLFDFCGLAYTDQTAEFIRNSTSTYVEGPYSVYKDRSVQPAPNPPLDASVIAKILSELQGSEFAKYLIDDDSAMGPMR